MMRRVFAAALALMLVLALCGCRREEGMYIEAAQLTRAEEDMAALLCPNRGSQLICDYRVDGEARSLEVSVWELAGGVWERTSGGGGYLLTGGRGRLALRFDDLSGGLCVTMQDESGTTTTEHRSEAVNGNLARGTATLSGRESVEYGREIPLAVQTCASGEQMESLGLECFYEPERAEGQNYSHVYALTACFDVEELE